MSWRAFEEAAPRIAAAGRRLLTGSDGVSIAFLATGGRHGPRLAPVCPFWSAGELMLIASTGSPKARDLLADPRYALHAFLGADDEEFQIRGRAAPVEDAASIARIHGDVPFASFGKDDPVFRLSVSAALHVYWERVGQPDTRAIRERWEEGK